MYTSKPVGDREPGDRVILIPNAVEREHVIVREQRKEKTLVERRDGGGSFEVPASTPSQRDP